MRLSSPELPSDATEDLDAIVWIAGDQPALIDKLRYRHLLRTWANIELGDIAGGMV